MPLHNTNNSSSRRDHKNQSSRKDSRVNNSNPPQSTTISRKVLKTPGLVTLDGRTLEGGGQLVRVALTLSALLSIPVYVHHVRGKRASRGQSGGLKESHIAALEFLREACGAEVYGAGVGGTEVVFVPGAGNRRGEIGVGKKTTDGDNDGDDGGHVVIELKNPGSVWLIFQAVYPYILFRGRRMRRRRDAEADQRAGPVKLTIRGGTNVSMSMSAEYVQQVFLPTMEKIGLPRTEVVVNKRGWTHGRLEVGEVEFSVTPLSSGERLDGFSIRDTTNAREGNGVKRVMISAMASPTAVLEHLLHATQENVRAQFPDAKEVEVLAQEDSGDPRRMYLLLVAQLHSGWRIGRDWLFDRKLKNNDAMAITRQMAGKVVADLRAEVDSGGCVDEFMQDQLVIFQTLATGMSEVDAGVGREEGSEHTMTVKWVVEQMLGKEMFAGDTVEGCGLLAGTNCPVDLAQEDHALVSGFKGVSLDG